MNSSMAAGFQAFSLLHGAMLAGCVVMITWAIRVLTRRASPVPVASPASEDGGPRRMANTISIAGLGFWLIQQGYFLLVDKDGADNLPLHVCDVAGVVGPLALLTRARVLRTTLYFWAFGLTVWGLLTPALAHGPEHLRFWLFWVGHGVVMFYAGYDCVVNGYRPTASDWGTACLVTMAYLAVLLPLNLANPGWNYGYIGDVSPGTATPLNLLPAWPWRVLAVQAAGALMLALVWLPWEVAGWRRGKLENA